MIDLDYSPKHRVLHKKPKKTLYVEVISIGNELVKQA